MSSLACAGCPVRDRAACSVLSEDERDRLARAGSHRRLKRGELLFAAGDEDAACATLIRGALKVSAVDDEDSAHLAPTPDGSALRFRWGHIMDALARRTGPCSDGELRSRQ